MGSKHFPHSLCGILHCMTPFWNRGHPQALPLRSKEMPLPPTLATTNVCASGTSPNLAAPSISPRKHQDPATATTQEERKSRHARWFEVSISCTLANGSHLCQRWGIVWRQREKKMLFSTSIQKRAARRFYSSRQHPIASQQFALTTKLSKKKQRRGHLSDGLRRSQLLAQETAKKPPKPAYHISPSYWSMTKRRIYGKRGQRGEKQKSIGSNRAWRKITSLIKRGYLPG